MSEVSILVGAQWGDEGKGKWVDILAAGVDIVARFQGGNNAGHTLYVDGKKIVLHQLPSGIFHNKISALLSGVVVNPVQLVKEMHAQASFVKLSAEKLWISDKAHVITPYHIYLDKKNEENSEQAIGTTKRGIGPTYSAKVDRIGMRMQTYIQEKERKEWIRQMQADSQEFLKAFQQDPSAWDEFEAAATELQAFVQAAEQRVREQLNLGKSLLLEGAQGTLLDINHGTYPFVTSSCTIAGGAVSSLGIDPRRVTRIYGVSKAYVTRVGNGPFPSELHDEVGKIIGEKGHEFGATTKRPRRCGWFDAVAMKYAVEVNGFDSIFINKMDILNDFKELKIASSYSHPTLGELRDFPSDRDILEQCIPQYETFPGWVGSPSGCGKEPLCQEAERYIKRIEELCHVKVSMIGTGPGRDDFIERI